MQGEEGGTRGDPLHGPSEQELKIPNAHNCVDLRVGGGWNIPSGWVAPTLHKNFLTFSPTPLVTSRQERQLLFQDWTIHSPLRTPMTSKICQTTHYKCIKRRGRSEEVVERYERSILGKLWTTQRLEKEGFLTKHPSRYMKNFPLLHSWEKTTTVCYHPSPSAHWQLHPSSPSQRIMPCQS